MRKAILFVFFSFIILISSLSPCKDQSIFGAAQDYLVGGTIYSDTIWTADKSPFVITEDIYVPNSVTLKIQGNVIIKGNNHKIIVAGTLIAGDNGCVTFINTSIMIIDQGIFLPVCVNLVEMQTYTITASASNGGDIFPSGTVVINSGDNQTFTFAPHEGYYLVDVIVDGDHLGSLSEYTFKNISTNHTIYAIFSTTKAYYIKTTVSKGGKISPSGLVPCDFSTFQTFTITPNNGYKIKDVKVDGVSVGAVSTYTFYNITSDHTIEAVFEPLTFFITTIVNSGGTIMPLGSIGAKSNESMTFTVSPSQGYKIKDVKVDGVSVGAVSTYTFYNITSDHTIEAVFEPLKYKILVSFSSGGFIAPSQITDIDFNTNQTFTITPNNGYKIKDVKVDGVSVGAVSTYTFYNITSDHTIEAVFEPIQFVIKATSSEGGLIFPLDEVLVDSGSSIKFTIKPHKGYKISDVIVDGISVGAVYSYRFEDVNSDHMIHVEFTNQIIIVLRVGNKTFTLNGELLTLDSPPIIKNGRTLLPIRAIIEALGGTVEWNASEKKVTVSLEQNTIELWIGKPQAAVNGEVKWIDDTNHKVVPEIINGRTMLPLRFVAENLGAQVGWDNNQKMVTIIY